MTRNISSDSLPPCAQHQIAWGTISLFGAVSLCRYFVTNSKKMVLTCFTLVQNKHKMEQQLTRQRQVVKNWSYFLQRNIMIPIPLINHEVTNGDIFHQ